MHTPLQLPEDFEPTHQTGGLPNFPAIDMFSPASTPVLAPEAGEVTGVHLINWDDQARIGGWTMYYQGESGDTYFLTHFATITHVRRRKKGDLIGQIAIVPHNWWQSHIHEGKHKGRFEYGGPTQAPPAPFSIRIKP